MRFIYVLLLAFGLSIASEAAVRQYRGKIDFSLNSVTTAYELVLTNTLPVKSLLCNHSTSGLYFWVSIGGSESDCSDATDDVLLGPGQSLGIGPGAGGASPGDLSIGKYICIKTDSGTASTGKFNCISSYEGRS